MSFVTAKSRLRRRPLVFWTDGVLIVAPHAWWQGYRLAMQTLAPEERAKENASLFRHATSRRGMNHDTSRLADIAL